MSRFGDVVAAGRDDLAEECALHGVPRDGGEIMSGTVMTWHVETMRRLVMRVVHAQPVRQPVHLRYESSHRARYMLRQGHGGIVGGVQQEAVEKVVYRK